MFNVREEITQKIIAAIEAGTPPWRKGWASMAPHFNASTGKQYQGINQVLLGMSGYSDPRWMTMKQANALKTAENPNGLRIRKGEKATMIVRMVEVEKRGEDDIPDGDVIAEDKKTRLVMKAFNVFNASQIEGMPPLPKPEPREFTSNEAVGQVVDGLKKDGVVLLHGGDRACYVPKIDTIKMPDQEAFESSEDYHATLLHEAAHATGAKKRLDRFGIFGHLTSSESYAREELRAELASAMLGAELGIRQGEYHVQNHAAYLASWLEALRKDKNEIFKAAAHAQNIADWLKEHAVKPALDEKTEHAVEAANEASVASPEPSIARRRARM